MLDDGERWCGDVLARWNDTDLLLGASRSRRRIRSEIMNRGRKSGRQKARRAKKADNVAGVEVLLLRILNNAGIAVVSWLENPAYRIILASPISSYCWKLVVGWPGECFFKPDKKSNFLQELRTAI